MTQFLVAVKIVSVCTFAFGFTDTCFNRLQFCPACFQKHRQNGVYSLQMILQQLGTDNPVTSKSLDVNPLYLLLEHLQPEIQFSVGCFALLRPLKNKEVEGRGVLRIKGASERGGSKE